MHFYIQVMLISGILSYQGLRLSGRYDETFAGEYVSVVVIVRIPGPEGVGVGGWVLSLFSSYVGSGPASTVYPPKISGISSTLKIIEILANSKNIPHSVH